MSRFILPHKLVVPFVVTRPLQGLLAIICAWALLGGLVACGFQLRGSQSLSFQTISIGSAQKGPVLEELTAKLKLKDITIIDGAAIHLILGRELFQKKAIQMGRSGSVAEYELAHQIDVSIVQESHSESGRNEAILPAPEIIRVVRRFSDNQTQLLAKKEEEVLIRKEMVSDIVQQIFFRLQALDA